MHCTVLQNYPGVLTHFLFPADTLNQTWSMHGHTFRPFQDHFKCTICFACLFITAKVNPGCDKYRQVFTRFVLVQLHIGRILLQTEF